MVKNVEKSSSSISSLWLIVFLVVYSSTSTVVAYPAFYATTCSNNNSVESQSGHGGGGGSGRYSQGGPSQQSSNDKENWNGRCSSEQEMLPEDSAATQHDLVSRLAHTYYGTGSIRGCSTRHFSFVDGTVLQVSSIFWCTLSSAKCDECFLAAVQHIQDMCSGRSGVVYKSDERCCLRYEVYNICNTGECLY